MPKYEAEFDIPLSMDTEQLAEFVEALREYGYPRLVFRIEAPSRKAAASQVGESTSGFWHRGAFDAGWWSDQLKAIRGRRAEVEL